MFPHCFASRHHIEIIICPTIRKNLYASPDIAKRETITQITTSKNFRPKMPTPIAGLLSFIYPLIAGGDKVVFDHALSLAQIAGGALILPVAAGNNPG